jgi:glycerol-3-phosphate acyltransferase PlsY
LISGVLNSANILSWLLISLAAYLIGAVPTAYLAVRWLKGQDVRSLGDGNAGAANAALVLGARGGLVVGAIDIAKGLAVVLLARGLLGSLIAEMIAGILVIIGHAWPVYLRGRGGRGAATAVGVLLATVPLAAAPLAGLSLVVLYFSKSSTRALAAMYIPLPFLAWWPAGYSYPLVVYSLAVPVLVGICHYLSLRRGLVPPSIATGVTL